LSRKRGDAPGLLEAGLTMTEGFQGRFLSGSVLSADGEVVLRQIFLLPFGKKDCPAGWYGEPLRGTKQSLLPSAQCRYFRIEVFNGGEDPVDVQARQQSPELRANWKRCTVDDEPVELTGSAHEPPRP
jgi:hypothetical protein